MTKLTTILLFSFIAVMLAGSCTIEKRLYNKGFHVEWRKYEKTSDSKSETNRTIKDSKPTSVQSSETQIDSMLSEESTITSIQLECKTETDLDEQKNEYKLNSSTTENNDKNTISKEIEQPEESSIDYGYPNDALVYCIFTLVLGLCALGFSIAIFINPVDILIILTLILSITTLITGFMALFQCQFEPGSFWYLAIIGMGMGCIAGLLFYLTLKYKII